MSRRLSRRVVTDYVAERLIDGDERIIELLAAYLIDSGETANVGVYIRDVERHLSERGLVLADVSTARKLDEALADEISSFIKNKTSAREVILRHEVNETLLGGVKLEIPGYELDRTLSRQLNDLRMKFKEA